MQKGLLTHAYCKDTDHGNARLSVECLPPLGVSIYTYKMQNGVTTSVYCTGIDQVNAEGCNHICGLPDRWHAKLGFFFGGGPALNAADGRSSAMQLVVLCPALVS